MSTPKIEIIEINDEKHLKVRDVIDFYQFHKPLCCETSTYMARLGMRRRRAMKIEMRRRGQMSGLFIPYANLPQLIGWLDTRRTLALDMYEAFGDENYGRTNHVAAKMITSNPIFYTL